MRVPRTFDETRAVLESTENDFSFDAMRRKE
jgi:hypothetical protein